MNHVFTCLVSLYTYWRIETINAERQQWAGLLISASVLKHTEHQIVDQKTFLKQKILNLKNKETILKAERKKRIK